MVGRSLFDYENLEDYLRDSRTNQAAIDQVENFGARTIHELIERIRRKCEQASNTFRPLKYEDRNFVTALWRLWANGALIHSDDLDINEANFPDGRVKGTQASSFSFCISQAEEGGETVVYNHLPTEEDLAKPKIGDYGFDPSIVSWAESISFRPNSGDVYIFNSSLPHEVKPVNGTTLRITRNSLCTELDGEILYW